MKIQKTTRIETSPEHLWQFLTDPEKVRSWTPSVVSDEPISSGPPEVGFKSLMKIKEGSKIVEYDSEITIYAPERQLGLVLRGGNLGKGPMDVMYTLEPEPHGTSLTYEARWQPHGLMLKLMSPIITRIAQNNVIEQMGLLKSLAEAEAKTTTPV